MFELYTKSRLNLSQIIHDNETSIEEHMDNETSMEEHMDIETSMNYERKYG